MIRPISKILCEKRALSFEIYPPKTEAGMAELWRAVEQLVTLDPDYVSVTYRAGGSSSKATLDICKEIQRRFDLTAMHHLTLVNQTRAELVDVIKRIRDAGILNVLALRGDAPPEMGGAFRPIPGGLHYGYELIDLIHDVAPGAFTVAVAGYPEKHPECATKELDTRHLKMKVDRGVSFIVTQMFFDNAVYGDYLDRAAAGCVNVPIVAGLLPITDYDRLLKFCDACGAYICDEVHKVFGPIRGNIPSVVEAGVNFAIRQARDLFDRGAPGIHFYSLNKAEPVKTIWNAVKSATLA